MVRLCAVPADWQDPVRIWESADGRFRLSELVHNEHLFHETIYLRHDVAIRPLDPEKLQWGGSNSYYLHRIKTGKARVFSFTGKEKYHMPLVTVIVDLSGENPVFEHIWAMDRKPVPADAEFQKPLQLALQAIEGNLGCKIVRPAC